MAAKDLNAKPVLNTTAAAAKTADAPTPTMIDPALVAPNSGIRTAAAAKTADASTPTMVDPALVAPNSGIRTAVQTVTPATDKPNSDVPGSGTSAIGDTTQTSAAEYRNVKQSPITQPTTGTVAMTGTGVSVPEAPNLKPILDQWRTAAEKAQQAQIDYATQKGIEELQRAQEDAQKQFKAAQEQISAEEAWNKDNQALYAEARGDKGGIGAAQYDSVMNTAAINRQQVRQQQTQLATDTWRQISDLRAQGEFKKADAVLQIAQTYLSNLLELEQWAANYGLSAAQFAESIREWESNFEAQVANITGYYKGQATYAREKEDQSKLASAGSALLNAGIMPSAEQLSAMGLSGADAQAMMDKAKAKSSGGGGGGGSTAGQSAYAALIQYGAQTEGQAYDILRTLGYKDAEAKTFAQYYIADLNATNGGGGGSVQDLFTAAYNSGAGAAYITDTRLKQMGLSDYDKAALQKEYTNWVAGASSPYVDSSKVSDDARALLNSFDKDIIGTKWAWDYVGRAATGEVGDYNLSENDVKWLAERMGYANK